MAAPTQPRPLPASLGLVVERAMAGEVAHADAIDAIERHLAEGGERTPELLVALATLTYEDAATVVLSRLSDASAEAVSLIDEALASFQSEEQDAAEQDELRALREVYEQTSRRERARERRLRALLGRRERARPSQLAELAHRILMSGADDGLAFDLMAEATERAPIPSDVPPARASGE